MRIKLVLIGLLSLPLISTNLYSQESIEIFGRIMEHADSNNLENPHIYAVDEELTITTATIKKSGNYKLEIDFDHKYKIFYSNYAYRQKHIIIDTRNIPKNLRINGYTLNVDMTVFETSPSIDCNILNEAVATAKYNNRKNMLEWDLVYTWERKKSINKLLRENENILDEDSSKIQNIEFTIYGSIISLYSSIFLEDPYVIIFQNDSLIGIYGVNKEGEYTLTLPYNSSYRLYYSAKDFVSKNIEIDLTIPPEHTLVEDNLSFNAVLFKKVQYRDYSQFDEAIKVFKFNSNSNLIELY